jgi:hypothetical protein
MSVFQWHSISLLRIERCLSEGVHMSHHTERYETRIQKSLTALLAAERLRHEDVLVMMTTGDGKAETRATEIVPERRPELPQSSFCKERREKRKIRFIPYSCHTCITAF